MNYAKEQFELLRQEAPEAVILNYEAEIIALCNKFYEEGHSGVSASIEAHIITSVISKLLLLEPIIELKEEDFFEYSPGKFQHKYLSSLFRDNDKHGGRPYYLHAIVWKENIPNTNQYTYYTGSVYEDDIDFNLIKSSLCISFPFKPKSFYVEVERIYRKKEYFESKNIFYHEHKEGDISFYYTNKVKNKKELKEALAYYGQ